MHQVFQTLFHKSIIEDAAATVYCTLELAQNPRLQLKTGLQQLMMKE